MWAQDPKRPLERETPYAQTNCLGCLHRGWKGTAPPLQPPSFLWAPAQAPRDTLYDPSNGMGSCCLGWRAGRPLRWKLSQAFQNPPIHQAQNLYSLAFLVLLSAYTPFSANSPSPQSPAKEARTEIMSWSQRDTNPGLLPHLPAG